jgi:cytochrome c-type biogenesis protein CcmH
MLLLDRPSRASLAVLLALTMAAAPASAQPLTQEDLSGVVSSRVLAPCCYEQTLDVHESPLASALRDEIRTRLRAGERPAEVEASLVARYGERVRAVPRDHDPRDPMLALVVLAMAFAAAMLVRATRRWNRRAPAAPAGTTAQSRDAMDARIDDELHALDEA